MLTPFYQAPNWLKAKTFERLVFSVYSVFSVA